ncbi:ImcF domain-containing protein, partial [Pseudomonas syringae pv. actinidiae ICMP 19096]
DALWPRYVEANNRWIRDPAAANLQRQLNALISLPPGSEQRAERAEEAYGQLKAYLMMARPQKADATFLTNALTKAEPVRAGVWQFYGEHLAAHPAWAIRADPKLVAQARQVLLAQMGQRNAQATLYQQVLDMAAHQYPALNLHDMVGATDALTLFSTEASVPGVFTRQ